MMTTPRCSNCGMPIEQGHPLTEKECRHCGHSSLARTSSLYDKANLDTEPEDAFKDDLSVESIFSKFAVISFFAFVVSLGVRDMQALTLVSFAGFLMFSAFYGFFRIRNSS